MSIEREQRKQLREELIRQGINPYPHIPKYMPTPVKEVISNPQVNSYVAVAGRIASIRRHGKLVFFDIIDDGYRIQAMINKATIGEERFEWFLKYINLGDFINVFGELFYTKRGELTINVRDYQLLTKALRSPPVKWGHRILDPEVRYRKRYLDLMMTPQVRRILEIRFKTIEEIRKFMWDRGFIEVETPILQPVYGGAAARPFKTHIWALGEEWYLRISLELYLKRFIVAGFNKVFEIGKNFRNEDIDVLHNPEFTMMEAYEAYADYNKIMRLTEDLISTVAQKVLGTTKVRYKVNDEEVVLDLSPPYKRIKLVEGLKEYAGIDVESLSDEDIKELLRRNNIVLSGGYDRGRAIVKLFDKLVGREHLIKPTFVIDFPASSSPLTKPHREDSRYAERFELYIAGIELANAYTELNDPVLQEEFFRKEEERRKLGDLEAHPYDWDFIEALEYGMPPTGGLGLGIDRLVMIFTGTNSIKEVIPFPMLKKTSGSY
ncbi:MAG: lysine--tRNA ligase [Desulfurococcales archaeon ex4484_42]|nr:MAG: lysine--tRNA ligase [Desulfurococcales archaeon ex4484_42]